MRRHPFSLLTVEEHRERERRERLTRRIMWAVLIIGALGALLTPCVHGFHC
jgi:hypothetical protein